jgi:hypothetical protein
MINEGGNIMYEFKEVESTGNKVLNSLIYSLHLQKSFIFEFEPNFYDCVYKVYEKGEGVSSLYSYLRVILVREIFRFLKSKRAQEKKNFLLYYNAL